MDLPLSIRLENALNDRSFPEVVISNELNRAHIEILELLGYMWTNQILLDPTNLEASGCVYVERV